ncbi:uncharacterized protein LOC113350663 [Papaver somniferum]|uniref:uncharacterized protein LOC113350663 n=1 Tax=Papaver somniferum TaxID=3469 RepID=UPI000E702A58|nr:uncharacterized protein LOC113350663 [Papaver somniferum]
MAWYLGWARPTVIRKPTAEELARIKKMASKDPATSLKFFKERLKTFVKMLCCTKDRGEPLSIEEQTEHIDHACSIDNEEAHELFKQVDEHEVMKRSTWRVNPLATVAKWFLHLKKTDLQRLELGLINQFLMVTIWVAFAEKTTDSFVLDNFGRLHKICKEISKTTKQLVRLFPNRVTIQLREDETVLLYWKQQLDRDIETPKMKSNASSILLYVITSCVRNCQCHELGGGDSYSVLFWNCWLSSSSIRISFLLVCSCLYEH